MNILLITSSPRKSESRTSALANEVLKGLGSGVNSEVIHLCDNKIEFCRQCEMCHKKIMKCPIRDNVSGILDKMLAADGIIFASPNYINQVTASMKALFDRSSHFIHCKRLLGKYIAGVVTSGSGQNKEVLDYIKHYSNSCGAQYAGGVSSGVPVDEKKNGEARGLGVALVNAIKDKNIFADQQGSINAGKESFKRIIGFRKEDWPAEYQFWKENNWL